MSPVDVSIIVPVYNAGSFLRRALPRLREQTAENVEIVIIDDGSSDDTAAIARTFAAGDGAVTFLSQESNGGVSKARERAVAASTGEFVWFVDADDDWPDDALSVMLEAATTAGSDVVVAGARFVYDGGASDRPLAPPKSQPVTGRAAFRLLLTGEITGHLWNKLIRRSVLAESRHAPARVHSDLALVASVLAHASTVSFLPDEVYRYQLRSGSIITSKSSRAASLEVVERAVRDAAAELDPRIAHSPEFRYFVLRYILLSGIKDAMLGPYPPAESTRIVESLRRRISPADLWMLARRRDARRLALAVSARVSPAAHRRLLSAASR